jgi:hypothetical protein
VMRDVQFLGYHFASCFVLLIFPLVYSGLVNLREEGPAAFWSSQGKRRLGPLFLTRQVVGAFSVLTPGIEAKNVPTGSP